MVAFGNALFGVVFVTSGVIVIGPSFSLGSLCAFSSANLYLSTSFGPPASLAVGASAFARGVALEAVGGGGGGALFPHAITRGRRTTEQTMKERTGPKLLLDHRD